MHVNMLHVISFAGFLKDYYDSYVIAYLAGACITTFGGLLILLDCMISKCQMKCRDKQRLKKDREALLAWTYDDSDYDSDESASSSSSEEVFMSPLR